MFESVHALLVEHGELQEELADPALHADAGRAKRVNRRYAELSRIVAAHEAWKQASDDLEAARERGEIARLDRDVAGLHWTADGRGVYFTADDRGTSNVWLATSGTEPRQVTTGTHMLSLTSASAKRDVAVGIHHGVAQSGAHLGRTPLRPRRRPSHGYLPVHRPASNRGRGRRRCARAGHRASGRCCPRRR